MGFWARRKARKEKEAFSCGYGWACCQVLQRDIPISAIEQGLRVSKDFGDANYFDKGADAAIMKLISLGVSTE